MRQTSVTTQIRNLKRQLKESDEDAKRYLIQRNELRTELKKQTADAVEWKQRFDILLEKCKSFEWPTE